MTEQGPSSSPHSAFDSDDLLAMVDHARDAIIAIDSEESIRFWNSAAEDLFGYERSEALGKNAHDLIAPEKYRSDIETGFAAFLETGEGPILNETREVDAKRRDGSVFPAELKINAFERDGALYAVAIVRDISPWKDLQAELEHQRDRSELYFETAGTIMGVMDLDGRVAHINERGLEVLGYDEDELLGESWFETVVPDDSPWDVEDVLEVLTAGERNGFDVHQNEVVTKSGERRTIKWHNSLLRDADGEIIGVLSSGADVTDQLANERQLERKNELLDEFASVVSHDLRNPLSVARGHAELAESECESDHFERVKSALDRMEVIIDNTLTLARQGKFVGDTEPLDIGSVTEEGWEVIDAPDATLEVVDGFTLRADPDRLQHLLENLFRNAVDHGGEGVSITVGRLDEDGFYVADDGTGIDPAARSEIFEYGHSADAQGTGLGLMIVKRVAEAHGWDVSVAESAAGGARFEFSGVEIR